MGVPAAYFDSNWRNVTQYLESVDAHLAKSVDHTVIDLTGSSPAQRNQVLDHLANGNGPNVDNVICWEIIMGTAFHIESSEPHAKREKDIIVEIGQLFFDPLLRAMELDKESDLSEKFN